MKKSKWLLFLIPGLLVLIAGAGIINWIVDVFVGSGLQHGPSFRHGHGQQGVPFQHHRMGPGGVHSIFGVFSLAFFLMKIGMILFGWYLWKKASGKKKWIGAAVGVIGLFSLLPWIIALPLTVFIGYVSMKKQSQFPIDNLEMATTTSEMMIQQISKKTREVFLHGDLLTNLTPKEFDLLYYFIQHPRQVFSRDQLLERVWAYDFYGDERTVDVHIKRLRNKIGSPNQPFLHTVWGVGYKFDDTVAEK